jgi:hypothetical protein
MKPVSYLKFSSEERTANSGNFQQLPVLPAVLMWVVPLHSEHAGSVTSSIQVPQIKDLPRYREVFVL